MVKAVVAADAIVGSLAGADRRDTLRPVPVFPVLTNDSAPAVAVSVPALVKTAAVRIFGTILA